MKRIVLALCVQLLVEATVTHENENYNEYVVYSVGVYRSSNLNIFTCQRERQYLGMRLFRIFILKRSDDYSFSLKSKIYKKLERTFLIYLLSYINIKSVLSYIIL